jgi:biotin carboxyl carrier protein
MSQMVGAQAVNNVLFGRYAVISDPVKEYVRGNYGRPVSEISAEIVDKVVEGDGGKSAPPPERPGAVLEPELDAARVAVADMTEDIDDVLTYALYPQTGLSFLRVKHGLEQAAEATPDEPEAAETTVSPSPKAPRSSRARRFNVYVGDSFFEVDVDPVGDSSPAPQPPTRLSTPVAAPAAQASPAQTESVAEGETPVRSPMPGILLSLAVEVGQRIESGEPLLVLEAMKMQNTIPSPVSGTVKSLPVAAGSRVMRDQVLVTIES